MLHTFSAAILAGGQSSRMGRDKAFITHLGRPLISVQAERLKALGTNDLLISGRPGTDYAVEGSRVVLDESPGCGPLAGLCAVLEAAHHPLVLVVAVDLPSLTVPWLRSLLDRCEEGKGVVMATAGGFEPLAAVYPRTVLPLALAALKRKELSLQKLLHQACAEGLMSRHTLNPVEERFLTNWNR